MKTGLFFGTFDPIHLGHIQVATNLITYDIVDEVWFVITPRNPFKKNQKISTTNHRMNMVNLAIKDNCKFKSSDIEFKLPEPQYTANTLRHVKKTYVDRNFLIAMGSDTYNSISEWVDHQYIITNFPICVYKRGLHPIINTNSVIHIPGDYIPFSSSYIRKNIRALPLGLLNTDVLNYALVHNLYT